MSVRSSASARARASRFAPPSATQREFASRPCQFARVEAGRPHYRGCDVRGVRLRVGWHRSPQRRGAHRRAAIWGDEGAQDPPGSSRVATPLRPRSQPRGAACVPHRLKSENTAAPQQRPHARSLASHAKLRALRTERRDGGECSGGDVRPMRRLSTSAASQADDLMTIAHDATERAREAAFHAPPTPTASSGLAAEPNAVWSVFASRCGATTSGAVRRYAPAPLTTATPVSTTTNSLDSPTGRHSQKGSSDE